MIMTETPGVFTKFESEKEKIELLKEVKLISAKATGMKNFIYNGAFTDKAVPCEVSGFKRYRNNEGSEYVELILFVSGKYHSVNPDYFSDMQSSTSSNSIIELAQTQIATTVDTTPITEKKEESKIVVEQLTLF